MRALFELTVAAICCAVPVALVRLVLRPALDQRLAAHPAVASALGRIGILLAFVAGYFAFTRWFERRRPTELAVRWRSLLLGGVSGSLLIGITVFTLFAGGYARLIAWRGVDQALGVAGLILVAATLEELHFRAMLFRLLERQIGTLWAAGAGAVAFGVLHLANPGAHVVTAVSVSVLGLLWTGVFVLSRNLWAAALHHAAWNLTIFASGMPLSGQDAWQALAPLHTTTTGSPLLTGGAFGPEDSLLSIAITSLACVAVFVMAARRRRLVSAADAARPRVDLPPPREAA